jgi:hypothetical protein
MNYLLGQISTSLELATVLSNANTKYLIFDQHLHPKSMPYKKMTAIKDMVINSNYFKLKGNLSTSKITVYENLLWGRNNGPVKNVQLSNENLNVFSNSVDSNKYFKYDSIVFAGRITLSDALKLKDNNYINSIYLHDYSPLELFLDFIRPNFEIQPNPNSLSSTGNHWYSYNETYQSELVGNYGIKPIGFHPVVSGGNENYVTFSIPKIAYGKNRLYIRTLISPNGGSIKVKYNNNEYDINTKSENYNGFHWKYIDEIYTKDENITIKIKSTNKDDLNIVDSVIFIPDDKFNLNKSIFTREPTVPLVKIDFPLFT